jgi:hypothetical protein
MLAREIVWQNGLYGRKLPINVVGGGGGVERGKLYLSWLENQQRRVGGRNILKRRESIFRESKTTTPPGAQS